MAYSLPTDVTTYGELQAARVELRRYAEWAQQSALRGKVGGKAKIIEEPSRSPATDAIIKAWAGTGPYTAAQLEDIAAALEKLEPQVVHLTLAALPNTRQAHELVTWFRKLAGDNLLVEVVADHTIGGGAVVRTPNRIFDFSFSRQLWDGRAAIGKAARRV